MNDHISNTYTLNIKTNIVEILMNCEKLLMMSNVIGKIQAPNENFICTSCIYSNFRMCTMVFGIFFLLQPLTNFIPLRFL